MHTGPVYKCQEADRPITTDNSLDKKLRGKRHCRALMTGATDVSTPSDSFEMMTLMYRMADGWIVTPYGRSVQAQRASAAGTANRVDSGVGRSALSWSRIWISFLDNFVQQSRMLPRCTGLARASDRARRASKDEGHRNESHCQRRRGRRNAALGLFPCGSDGATLLLRVPRIHSI
jgi:hypothetical protein